MGIFDDNKFEQLDWMTQITESIESELNGLLARLPERLEIDLPYVISLMDDSYDLSISTDGVVRGLLKKARGEDEHRLSYEDEMKVIHSFKLEVQPETTINFENRTMTGGIALVKVKMVFEDDELQKGMGRTGIDTLRKINWGESSISRMNEVLELLGGSCLQQTRNRSAKKKMNAIMMRLREAFDNNEWRIRDTELANKVGEWLAKYIRSGDLAAFTNFCKLKVMTHGNMPIYSISEEL